MTRNLQPLYLQALIVILFSLSTLGYATTPEDILSINDAEIDPLNNEVVDLSNNIFLRHMISSRAAGFEGPQYLPPKCERNEYCVTKSLCNNGYFTGQIQNSLDACSTEKDEVCCKYKAPVTQPQQTTPRPTTPRPTPPASIPCQDDNFDCVLKSQCVNGEIKSIYPKKKTSCNAATEVCCRFPSMSLEKDGYYVKVPSVTLPLPTPTQRVTPKPTPRITTKGPTYIPPEINEVTYQYEKPTTTKRPITTTKPLRGEDVKSPQIGARKKITGVLEDDTSRRQGQIGGQSKFNEVGETDDTRRKGQIGGTSKVSGRGETTSNEIIPSKKGGIQGNIQGRGDETNAFKVPFPSACAAAMNCTDIKFCNATGYISTTPVELTPAEEAFRVPMSDCRDPAKGLEAGKCCRDPDYVDPWPSSTIKPRERRSDLYNSVTKQPQKRTAQVYTTTYSQPIQRASTVYTTTLSQPAQQSFIPVCNTAQRRYDTEPRGRESIDANFKEFTWQIMVLKDSTKTLICGGSLIAPNVVLTSATCLKSQKSFDTVLKAGEWQLGSDIEPLKFDIKRASSIHLHPRYNPQTQENDMAVVFVEARFKYGGPIDHVSPICLDESDLSGDERCVTLGWGETALAYHLQDAIMHFTNVQPSANVYNVNGRNHIGVTEIDTSLVDPGSALACSRDQVNYYLKGIYTRKIGSNEIEFTRPDVAWINGLLYGQRFRG